LANSGVDVASDAARSARKADLSRRRGYRIVPKHIFGEPTDVLMNGMIDPPPGVPITLDPTVMLYRLNGDLTRLGLPKPDHNALTSHPIMNTQVLHHLSHGDLAAKSDIAEFRAHAVLFNDGSEEPVDLALFATGYAGAPVATRQRRPVSLASDFGHVPVAMGPVFSLVQR
jgi:Flavin-binding monooxygenase-like